MLSLIYSKEALEMQSFVDLFHHQLQRRGSQPIVFDGSSGLYTISLQL